MNNYYRDQYSTGYIQNQPIINKSPSPMTNQIRDVENFMSLNIGKKAKIYMSFPDSIELRDKVFIGTLQAVGLDYILIRDTSNMPILLQKLYLNYIEFDETVNY